ncbi:MAG: hypothetical protein COA79_12730 [Planctomycetota bacterium]|nr:MAG: hypothetical protein COA79_12730 [Planctomycetota bacterium]
MKNFLILTIFFISLFSLGAEDDAVNKMMAEKEKEKGAVFVGPDPAYLVMPRPLERTNVSRDLLTDEVKKMIQMSLSYLADNQSPDGSWSDKQFPNNTGVSSLACLAFMAAGDRPRIGKYGKNLDKGIGFLLQSAKSGGLIAGAGSSKFSPIYEHLYASMALIYAYGEAPWYPHLRKVISKALQVIFQSQRRDGGWRYLASKEGRSDVSVTTTAIWVLRSAKKCGFHVPKKAIASATKLIDQCAKPDGKFHYRMGGRLISPALAGKCIVSLMSSGRLDHPLIAITRDEIAFDFKRYSVKDLGARRYAVHNIFSASVGMYPCGDEYWVPWFKKSTAVLKSLQRKNGEFFDDFQNTIYPTAFAVITLQAPLGYLPIYER